MAYNGNMCVRLFVFSDIHANLPAFEAICRAAASESPDVVIHLGDAVDMGPHPAEVVNGLAAQSHWHCLKGNHELFMLGYEKEGTDELELLHRAWTRSQLAADDLQLLRDWPICQDLQVEDLPVRCIHYALEPTQTAFSAYFEPEPDAMEDHFVLDGQRLVLFGHLHRPINVYAKHTHFVGLPSSGASPVALAAYTLVDVRGAEYCITHKAVVYDDHRLFADMERKNVPAREFLYQAFYGGRFTANPSS